MNDQERPRGRGYGFRRWSAEDDADPETPSPYPRTQGTGGYEDYNPEFDPTGGSDFDDEPSRFDISTYREGLFGGPGADLIGNSDYPQADDPGGPGSAPYDGYLREPVDTGWQHAVDAGYPAQQPEPEPNTPEVASTLVRPYSRTGGRTRSDYDLAIEALVSTSSRGMQPSAASTAEHRSICGLCMDARSVAEVAAHLRLPLGVARVLIGDMAGLGLVTVHQSSAVVGDRPSMDFLERVLSGLRRL